jgi:hypothetical protein
MDEQQPLQMPGGSTPKKKWLKLAIIGAAIIVVAIIVMVVLALTKTKDQPEGSKTPKAITGSKEFKMTTNGSLVTYAGSPVYDACGLIPFDAIRKNVKDYQTILDMNGTDKKPSQPLTIEHRYVDRLIAAPLGKDAQPRSTGTVIGGQAGVSASSFISDADSNCWYGQGSNLSLGLGRVFAKVYVTQYPTPLSADLTAYLATLTKAGSEGDLDAYVEPQTDSGGFFTGIVTNGRRGVAVIIKTSTRELAQVATVNVSDTLSQSPKAPMNLIYPLAWSAMPNPCTLLSAEDFAQATGKPASPLAEDVMTLNELGGRLMQRSCKRLEVERLDGTEIAKSNVTVRLSADANAAKQYVETIKNDKERYSIQPLKQRIQLADDAYIKTVLKDGKAAGYEFDMRLGNAVIVLAVDKDSGLDPSADAFAGRILSLAKSVAEKYRKE